MYILEYIPACNTGSAFIRTSTPHSAKAELRQRGALTFNQPVLETRLHLFPALAERYARSQRTN